jgi:hypothetical protein
MLRHLHSNIHSHFFWSRLIFFDFTSTASQNHFNHVNHCNHFSPDIAKSHCLSDRLHNNDAIREYLSWLTHPIVGSNLLRHFIRSPQIPSQKNQTLQITPICALSHGRVRQILAFAEVPEFASIALIDSPILFSVAFALASHAFNHYDGYEVHGLAVNFGQRNREFGVITITIAIAQCGGTSRRAQIPPNYVRMEEALGHLRLNQRRFHSHSCGSAVSAEQSQSSLPLHTDSRFNSCML